jgi:phage-related protein
MEKIVYYVSRNGNNPIKVFLDSLNQKQQVKILRILGYIKEYGLQSVIPHLKKLSGTPLWEIRILGKDNIRLLYILEFRNTIIILHGFIKKTQKTEKQDIIIALNRFQDWKSKKLSLDR